MLIYCTVRLVLQLWDFFQIKVLKAKWTVTWLISCVCRDEISFKNIFWQLLLSNLLFSISFNTDSERLWSYTLNRDLRTAHSLALHSNTKCQNVTLTHTHTHTHTHTGFSRGGATVFTLHSVTTNKHFHKHGWQHLQRQCVSCCSLVAVSTSNRPQWFSD